MDIKKFLNDVFQKLGVLNEDQQVSITNITVIVFLTITAFRSMFGGMEVHINDSLKWTVQMISYADTLPLMFSLLNYSHKRQTLNKKEETNETTP